MTARQAHERPAPERIDPSLSEQETAAVHDLRAFRGNARRHDLGDIRAKLRVHGQVDVLVVNRGTYTGRPMEVVSGNGRLAVMREDGWTRTAVRVVDLDEQTLTKWVVMLNPPEGRDPGHDKRALVALLASLDDIEGTGYSPDDAQALADSLTTDPPVIDDEEDPLPDDDDDLDVSRMVVITCMDESEQMLVLEQCLRHDWSAAAVTR